MPIDELVRQAMARWPDVPAVFGWLRLDRRGRWLLVDRGAPGFDEAQHGAGSEITNPQIVAFIGRNYLHDEQGRWYWQNGPQRAFVDAAPAPLVFRVFGEAPRQGLTTHTGEAVSRIDRAASDPAGNLWLATDLGPGLVDDRDLAALDLEDTGHDEPTGRDPAEGGPAEGDPAHAGEARADAGRGGERSRAEDGAHVLNLMGRHRLERLSLRPPEAFGFVERPR